MKLNVSAGGTKSLTALALTESGEASRHQIEFSC